jgi:hypothetical protein
MKKKVYYNIVIIFLFIFLIAIIIFFVPMIFDSIDLSSFNINLGNIFLKDDSVNANLKVGSGGLDISYSKGNNLLIPSIIIGFSIIIGLIILGFIIRKKK